MPISGKNKTNNKNGGLGSSSKSAPAAYSKRLQNQKPKISTAARSTTITHKEFVGNIEGSVAFHVQEFDTNPGGGNFPWLATQAAGWEQYRYRKLKFFLISRRGTTSDGSVLAAIDYNVYDAAPETEEALMTYAGAVENNLWEEVELTTDLKAFHAGSDRKYIRTGLPPGDLKSYDGGRLYVATVGDSAVPAGGVTHKLWVEYVVDFFVPETESKKRPIGFAEFGLAANQALVQATNSNLLLTSVRYNGIGAVLNMTGDGWLLPKGFYQLSANNSVSATGGASPAQYNVRTTLRALLNGVVAAASDAGGVLQDSLTSDRYQLENTVQGCFEVSEDGADFIMQVNPVDDFTALTWLAAAASTSVILKKLG